jgi:hypothetical protein
VILTVSTVIEVDEQSSMRLGCLPSGDSCSLVVQNIDPLV